MIGERIFLMRLVKSLLIIRLRNMNIGLMISGVYGRFLVMMRRSCRWICWFVRRLDMSARLWLHGGRLRKWRRNDDWCGLD